MVSELIIEAAESGVDLRFRDACNRADFAVHIMVSADMITFPVYHFLSGMNSAVSTIYGPWSW